ncbi:hypothetical protein L210DRAFT_3514070, partial [Boletus edulis BED1]
LSSISSVPRRKMFEERKRHRAKRRDQLQAPPLPNALIDSSPLRNGDTFEEYRTQPPQHRYSLRHKGPQGRWSAISSLRDDDQVDVESRRDPLLVYPDRSIRLVPQVSVITHHGHHAVESRGEESVSSDEEHVSSVHQFMMHLQLPSDVTTHLHKGSTPPPRLRRHRLSQSRPLHPPHDLLYDLGTTLFGVEELTDRFPLPSAMATPSRRLDLITGILGVQVDICSLTIEWTSGQRTVLPFLPRAIKDLGVRNVLAQDASSLVVFLDKNTSKTELFKAAREALSLSKSVLVKNFVDSGSFEFTIDNLEEHLMISPRMPVKAQGIKLDDALGLGWVQPRAPPIIERSPSDPWTVWSWGFAYHGGTVTYPHHDADGAGMFIVVTSGVENVVLTRPRHPRKGLSGFLAPACQASSLISWACWIQRPSIFIPEISSCFAWGRHYFNLDTMHLTELSRFMDKTNDVHYGTLETLCRLVIGLTILPKSRTLCGMVAHHASYVTQGTTPRHSETLDVASTIARAILVQFGLNDLEGYQAFLDTTDTFDRGEAVDLHTFLHSLI